MADHAVLRGELHAAKEAGDISLSEYLAELRKLREGAAGPALGSSSAAAALSFAPAASTDHSLAKAAAHDDSSDDDDDLVDEDERPWKRQAVTSPERDGRTDEDRNAPDTASSAARRAFDGQQPGCSMSGSGDFAEDEEDWCDFAEDEEDWREDEDRDDSNQPSPTASHARAPEATASMFAFEVGSICLSNTSRLQDLRLTVVHIGSETDFVNNGNIYVRYQQVKRG